MATTRPFAYNPTQATIPGTTNLGYICIGVDSLDYSSNPGGLTWWMGADEDISYLICKDVPLQNFPTPLGNVGGVQFWRSTNTDEAFRSLVQTISGTAQADASAAAAWLSSNGYWTSRAGSSFDPDAQAFITAANITNTTQQNAIDTLVVGFKADGLWDKMKAIYPVVGGSRTAHRLNLKDPRVLDAAFCLTFEGGAGAITHSANGMLPNGTTGYANTHFVPSDQIADPDSFHFSIYSRTSLGGFTAKPDIGAQTILGTDPESYIDEYIHAFYYMNYGGNTAVRHGYYSSVASFVDKDSLGLYVGNRYTPSGPGAMTGVTAYKNGELKNLPVALSPAALVYCPMLLMGMAVYYPDLYHSPDDFQPVPGARQLAFATIGDGLSNTDNTNLYARIQAFQTALGRAV